MPLSTYKNALVVIHSARLPRTPADPMHCLLRQGIKHLMDKQAAFDACLDENNPFYCEFGTMLQKTFLDEDDYFSLFECLTIFFRIRQCRQPQLAPHPVEQKVLRFFENSGQWAAQDTTLGGLWYWWRIPAGA